LNATAKAEILSRYQDHIARFDRDADNRRRPGLSLVPGEPVQPEPPQRLVLTLREQEVLGLIATGLTDTQIGEELVISESTVKTHVKRILLKLTARNRAHAVALAARGRLLLIAPA